MYFSPMVSPREALLTAILAHAQKRGWSKSELAAELGISSAVLSNWISRKAVSKDAIEPIAAKLGITLGPKGAPIEVADPPAMVHVGSGEERPLEYIAKVTGAHLSAGAGEVLWEVDEIQKSHAFRSDYLREKGLRPDKCKVWTVRGDSMEPRYRDGGVVLIDMSDRTPVHSKVYALVGEDGLRIKQLRRGVVGWEMHSYNPDQNKYPPEPIVGENYAIIGRVRWYAGDED